MAWAFPSLTLIRSPHVPVASVGINRTERAEHAAIAVMGAQRRLAVDALIVELDHVCKQPQTHASNGHALQNRGDLNGAIREYREAIKLNPNVAQPHNNLGNALRSQGNHEGALREYEVALRLEPFYKFVHYNMATELEQRGRGEQAAAHYKAACPDLASIFCPAAPQVLNFEEQCAIAPCSGAAKRALLDLYYPPNNRPPPGR